MKKIITLFALFLVFTFSVNAQETNPLKIKAKEETVEVAEFLSLSAQRTNEIYDVMLYKNKKLSDASVNREELIAVIKDKFRELLTKEEFTNFISNTELYKKTVE